MVEPEVEKTAELAAEKGPEGQDHIAPGWDTDLVTAFVADIFVQQAGDRNPDWDGDSVEILPEEMERASPGIRERTRRAVSEHRISSRLHNALEDEVVDIAHDLAETLTKAAAEEITRTALGRMNARSGN